MGFAIASGGSSTAGAQTSGPSELVAPAWAFPVKPATDPAMVADSVTPLRVPHSKRTYTARQVLDRFMIPDWFPTRHPAMPPVVASGRRPAVQACAYCHLPDGRGRPENAALAGLPAAYIVEQLADMKAGTRHSARDSLAPAVTNMRNIAVHATPDEAAEAARYFAALRFTRPRTRVVETDSLPKLRTLTGVYGIEGPNAEPIGQRLVDATADATRHELHDPDVPYVTYAPRGSIARGRAIATAASPKACASCHGPQLRGLGATPPIAGRAPSFLLRQLLAFKTGTRSSAAAAPMRDVAATLSLDDLIAVSAYAGSRKP